MSKKNKFPDFSQWDFDGETLYDFELRTLNQKRKKKRKTPSKITNNSITSINQSCEEEFIEQYLEFQPDSISVAGDVEKEYKRFSAERGIKQAAYTFQAYLLKEYPEVRRVEKYIPELDKKRVVLEGIRLKEGAITMNNNEQFDEVLFTGFSEVEEEERVAYTLSDKEVVFADNVDIDEEEIDDIFECYEHKGGKKHKKKSKKVKKSKKKSKQTSKQKKSEISPDRFLKLDNEVATLREQQHLRREELLKSELRILWALYLDKSNKSDVYKFSAIEEDLA